VQIEIANTTAGITETTTNILASAETTIPDAVQIETTDPTAVQIEIANTTVGITESTTNILASVETTTPTAVQIETAYTTAGITETTTNILASAETIIPNAVQIETSTTIFASVETPSISTSTNKKKETETTNAFDKLTNTTPRPSKFNEDCTSNSCDASLNLLCIAGVCTCPIGNSW
jgi:hypothetical protein